MLSYINDRLAGRYDADTVMFVTAWYGVFDPQTLRLDYAAAGHPPPRLCRNGQLQELDQAGGLPLGIKPHSRYDTAHLTLESGDNLLLFTDGITEAFDAHRKQFGQERLDALLCHEECGLSPQNTIDTILREVRAHTAGAPHEDDQTLLAVRIR